MSRHGILAVIGMALASAVVLRPGAARADQSPSAADLLKHSMVRYQSLQTFQARCTWREFGTIDTRTIAYVKPNRFRIVSHNPRIVMTAVCDGTHLAEYTDQPGLQAMTYAAPPSIAKATSMQMQHPMFCGSLLYKFFGGPDALANLADAGKGAIRYGKDVTINGEPCKTVLFYGTGLYGHTQAAISVRDGLVRRIVYDSAPLIAMMGDTLKKQHLRQSKAKPPSLVASETYGQIVVDQPVADATFDATLPQGLKATDMTQAASAEDEKPPVPLGSDAPDFAVTPLKGGQPVRLSSLRGQVVLLDFWATWCPPCRKGLPETQALFSKWSRRGLQVMTIDDEDASTIGKFLTKNRYTFPSYRDAGGQAEKAYHINAIPTLAVIDTQGHLVNYFVGLQDPATVRDALKKAGLSGA